MSKRSILLVITLLLSSTLTVALNTRRVEAEGAIYIRADGSIDPPTAPISTVDNVTYTLTSGISGSIIIERDNIVVDGAHYIVEGAGSGNGMTLSGRSNVTMKNMTIKAFDYGINLNSSSGNSIFHNKFVYNTVQVYSNNSTNVWDNGYPSGGNYWSDYNGTDQFRGPYQNETGSDGVGDTPYSEPMLFTDRYPLMFPFGYLPGDVNHDHKVDIFDAMLAAASFGSVPGNSRWNLEADINHDKTVNIFDLIILAGNFGKTTA